jgi:hypothetical protein
MSATRSELPHLHVIHNPSRRITSDDFRKRAKHYRLAAALADAPQSAAMLDELATMFDRLAHDFRRAEAGPQRSH